MTNDRLRTEVERLAGDAIGKNIRLQSLVLQRPFSRAVAHTTAAIVPSAKLLVYGDNLDFFSSLDVLVVPEKTSLLLKTRYRLDRLKIIHTRHGAGDRAIGFDKASLGFDHVLVSGEKIRTRLVDEVGLDPARLTIVGYPKFDLQPPAGEPRLLDERPVVLYNPHASPHLSSWYEMGHQVLDWFAAHEEYQLIFAPHVMLFERPFTLTIDKLRINRPGRIPQRFLRAPNIHIDLGSRASTTMAYTNRADIYLGDVSSQVYEFLLHPRPCLFLDAHGVNWRNDPNYAHWAAGSVLREVSHLGDALANAAGVHAIQYRATQQRMFDASFDLNGTPSSVRAAQAVAKVAGFEWPMAVKPRNPQLAHA